LGASSSKKLKTELIPKMPLAQVDRNTDPSETIVARPSIQSVEDARAKLQSVQVQISREQNTLDRVTRKSKKTKADLRMIASCTRLLDHYRMLKNRYNAQIPNMSPVKRTLSKPLIPIPVKAETSESVKLSPSLSPFALDRKPVVPHAQAIATGSNVRLPHLASASWREGIPNNTDDEMDVDENMSEEARAAPVLQRVIAANAIPAIAPLMGAGHHDENGDFHGRGKDLFVGPQAKADE